MSSSWLPPPPWIPVKNHRLTLSFASHHQSNHLSLSLSRRRGFRCGRTSRAAIQVESSWIPSNEISPDDFGGWIIPKSEIIDKRDTGWVKFLFVSFGASFVIFLVGLTYRSFLQQGLKRLFLSPFNSFCEKLTVREKDKSETKVIEISKQINDETADTERDKTKENKLSARDMRILVAVPADHTQQEALSVLKTLQIIENDATADEICTRREFARWFVKINSKLERNKKHRIVPNILIPGSVDTAFDDVSFDDPDFWFIQSLGEAGIVPSKLSSVDSSSSNNYFLPESYLSRFDLINWKTLIEYASANEKVTNKPVDFLDTTRGISANLLKDLICENSIISRVFGNIRFIQPNKPVTKAQAAVALTSGRMEISINEELNRLEIESKSKLAVMEEIKAEFIKRGEIPNFWGTKMQEEQEREAEARKALELALDELGKARKEKEEGISEYLKEKSSLESKKGILLKLEGEINELRERVKRERDVVLSEKESVEREYLNMCEKYESLIDSKSSLEAEKEALHVLRSWVEEEAIRIRTRADLLEHAVRRWKCNSYGDSVGKFAQ